MTRNNDDSTTEDLAGNPNPAVSLLAAGETNPNAPAGPVASPFPASIAGVTDAQSVADLAGRLKPGLTEIVREIVGDVNQQAREGVAEFVDDLAPEIAKQTILSQSEDPDVKARAQVHARHLRGQVVMRAGIRIVGFEQRREQQLVAAVDTTVSLARHWLTGGIA